MGGEWETRGKDGEKEVEEERARKGRKVTGNTTGGGLRDGGTN
jgi:hypothetical protein